MNQEIRLEHKNRVAVLTINRPSVLNALDRGAWRALRDALAIVATETPRDNVLVIRGAGERAFIAGADLSELEDVRRDAIASRAYIELVESVMSAVEHLPQPVITMVNGSAIGAGVELMAASDIRMARAGAHIGIPAVKLGLAITAQDIRRLERLIGLGRTQWLLLTGETITAEEGCSWGLVHSIHPSNQLEDVVMTLATRMARNSATSMQIMKESMRSAKPISNEDGFRQAMLSWAGDDLGEALQARAERREPNFGAATTAR